MGQMIEIEAAHDTVPAYLATTTKPRPGVVVIQEWWGLNDHIKDVCDRFGDGGLVALAPDIYRGETADVTDEAGRLMMGLEVPRALEDCKAGADRLLADESVRGEKIGVMGFCMGGGLALLAASSHPALSACVDFYGVIPWQGVEPDFESMRASVLGIFGSEDAFIKPDQIEALETSLTTAGVDVTIEMFDGCGHAFFNDTRPDVFDEDAASDAWQMVLDFFDENLR
jgi:carboxymethylenebutenolidase